MDPVRKTDVVYAITVGQGRTALWKSLAPEALPSAATEEYACRLELASASQASPGQIVPALRASAVPGHVLAMGVAAPTEGVCVTVVGQARHAVCSWQCFRCSVPRAAATTASARPEVATASAAGSGATAASTRPHGPQRRSGSARGSGRRRPTSGSRPRCQALWSRFVHSLPRPTPLSSVLLASCGQVPRRWPSSPQLPAPAESRPT
mmetsp:Transcript_79248/g.232746  ORF Transcript_79248/g.232746 Transcript_79248/m.232746 type:complete len:208 (-) Transcript_79248:376-999(-)